MKAAAGEMAAAGAAWAPAAVLNMAMEAAPGPLTDPDAASAALEDPAGHHSLAQDFRRELSREVDHSVTCDMEVPKRPKVAKHILKILILGGGSNAKGCSLSVWREKNH